MLMLNHIVVAALDSVSNKNSFTDIENEGKDEVETEADYIVKIK